MNEVAARRLRSDEFARLWQRSREALERNGRRLEGATCSLPAPSDAERLAVDGLLGGHRRGGTSLRIPLDKLDERLREGALGQGLIDWLESLDGPLRDRPTERSAAAARREHLWALADDHRLASESWFERWLAGLQRDGLIARLAPGDEDRLLTQALAVLDRLPADGTSRSVLAASLTGDAHALDGSGLGTVVTRALQDWAGVERVHNAGERRALWARFGVMWDDLAAQVLVLNLPVSDNDKTNEDDDNNDSDDHDTNEDDDGQRAGGLLAGWLASARRAGEPFRITLRQLVRTDSQAFPIEPGLVSVCENPAVLIDAATRLGAHSRALVCTEGHSSAAAHQLLTVLQSAGCTFRYHGDFDWGGLRMAAALLERYGMHPWRLSSDDYRAAVESLDESARLGLHGAPATSPWDVELAEVMAATAVAVHEEQVLDSLLDDLRH